jgi:hypothetical protein
MHRRTLVHFGAVAGVALAHPAFAYSTPIAAKPFADGVTLLVAGPESGATDRWADLLAPALGRGLPPGTQLRIEVLGGPDGVTGANRFEVGTAPDGAAAMLVPGSAALAWLVGDPRARFDAAHWVPGLAGTTPGVLASRIPLAALLSGARVRVGAASAAGPDLPMLLALELMGVNWEPVFNLTSEAALADALGRRAVDAVSLRGRRVPDQAHLFAASGTQPVFTFGAPDDGGALQRDPAFPALPSAGELIAQRLAANAALLPAFHAASAAAQLDVALVLPQLTPAAMVSVWRHACAVAAGSSEIQAHASVLGVRPLSAPAANGSTGAIAADAEVLLELRRWMATRLNYRAA